MGRQNGASSLAAETAGSQPCAGTGDGPATCRDRPAAARSPQRLLWVSCFCLTLRKHFMWRGLLAALPAPALGPRRFTEDGAAHPPPCEAPSAPDRPRQSQWIPAFGNRRTLVIPPRGWVLITFTCGAVQGRRSSRSEAERARLGPFPHPTGPPSPASASAAHRSGHEAPGGFLRSRAVCSPPGAWACHLVPVSEGPAKLPPKALGVGGSTFKNVVFLSRM